MDPSPYHPPQMPEGAPIPTPPNSEAKLFSTTQILVATFLGSMMAGGALLAMNGQRLKHSTPWPVYFGGSLVATALFMMFTTIIPESIPGLVLMIPQLLLAGFVTQRTQGDVLGELPPERQRGWLPVIGIALLLSAVAFFLLLLLMGGLGNLEGML